jgi:hypothetical protein
MIPRKKFYLNRQNLPHATYQHEFSAEELVEFEKCLADPVYFAETYIKIINVDKGLIPFNMYGFQKDMVRLFHENRFSITKCARQVGKSTCAISYLLWYVLFNEYVNIAIMANKAGTARDLLGKLQLAYENLPRFLQQGVQEWNKGSIELANGSRIVADSTTGDSVRGRSFNIVFLDEFAFVPTNIAEAFYTSTYPTISSGKTTKIIIVSTPNGMNHYYREWQKAVEGISEYKHFEVHWSAVPGRDEDWKEQTIRNTSEQQFMQEHECHFMAASGTLISAKALSAMKMLKPVYIDGTYREYAYPQVGHNYVITVDCARGVGLDYSAFSVIDITDTPYKQVGVYRNNLVQAPVLPTLILAIARKFNDAQVLIEVNDVGQQVAELLHFEHEYENVFKIVSKGKAGQQISGGFGLRTSFGLKTTTPVKRVGCAGLKTLVESGKLEISDPDTIMELTTFVAKNNSYEAEEGNHDDLAMTLVLFGWITAQRFFRENIDDNFRKVLEEEQLRIFEETFVPFGIIDNHTAPETFVAEGDLWTEIRNDSRFPSYMSDEDSFKL